MYAVCECQCEWVSETLVKCKKNSVTVESSLSLKWCQPCREWTWPIPPRYNPYSILTYPGLSSDCFLFCPFSKQPFPSHYTAHTNDYHNDPHTLVLSLSSTHTHAHTHKHTHTCANSHTHMWKRTHIQTAVSSDLIHGTFISIKAVLSQYRAVLSLFTSGWKPQLIALERNWWTRDSFILLPPLPFSSVLFVYGEAHR
jgi:hypothetical protein